MSSLSAATKVSVSGIIGVAGAGQGNQRPPFPTRHRARFKVQLVELEGAQDVPKIVDWYMEGKINIDDLITHVMPLEHINDALI